MALNPIQHHHASAHVRILGLPISDFSAHLLKEIASDAHLHAVHITSVARTVTDQARIFYGKHIVEGKAANYKNHEVAKIFDHARKLHKQGQSAERVKSYLISAIEHVRGGPGSISSHIGAHTLIEVFDVAHYGGPTTGAARRNAMTDPQARAFLAACRRRMPYPVTRLGHSAELGFLLPAEFRDEKCFHFEVSQPIYDKLEQTPTTMIA